jgi:hypothetical protein
MEEQPRIDVDFPQEVIDHIQTLADEKGISFHDMVMLIVQERLEIDVLNSLLGDIIIDL